MCVLCYVLVCCAVSLCVGVGADVGVQCVCGVWCVARLGTRKTPVCVDSKRLRVHVQDVSVCTHGGVLNPHTRGVFASSAYQEVHVGFSLAPERFTKPLGESVEHGMFPIPPIIRTT